jgi:biotin carboxylase
MSKKRILQLGAGPMLANSIRVLQEAGHLVYAADKNPHSVGFEIADGSAAIDIVDLDSVIEYAKTIGADMVLAVIEAGLLEASQACETLGLPNISSEVALNCLDKGRMRQCWDRANLPQPTFRITTRDEDPVAAANTIGFPLIVKPTFGWGSRGVSKVSSHDGFGEAVRWARENSRTGEIIIEEFIAGTEMTIEGVVMNGQCEVLAKSDKEHQEHEQYCVAMALNYGANFEASVLDRADSLMGQALKAVGHENGVFHCECMVNEDGVFLLETAARGGGGHIYSQIVEAVSGIKMPACHVDILLGNEPDIKATQQLGASYRFFSPPEGKFRSIQGIEKARAMPGILDIGFTLQPGETVGPITGDAARPGYVVSGGSHRNEAIANAQGAIAQISYDMDPQSP